ncbi:MAG TPA: potassium-transporting ATPase subunit C [Mycobacteriales bacterium]|jgi:K+-transporting ATPase ATPase C chain|nr:potassium-transporting ATPase subunit C [Mycobacteriales bacterium]
MRTVPGQLLAALRGFLVLSVVLGLGYPLVVAGIGRVAFAGNAQGSMVQAGGRTVGSDLIGQAFTDPDGNALPQYFQSRPSAAGDGYDPTATAASNRGPEDVVDTPDDPATPEDDSRTSLLTDICTRSAAAGELEGADATRAFCGPGGTGRPDERGAGGTAAVPPDAVTASASGLDPHISPAYARLQVARVAGARGLPEEQVGALVQEHEQGRVLGFLGEPRVNVLELNLALDRLGS